MLLLIDSLSEVKKNFLGKEQAKIARGERLRVTAKAAGRESFTPPQSIGVVKTFAISSRNGAARAG